MALKCNQNKMDWTADRVSRLTYLWGEGIPTVQIARLIGDGATKNSVIGKAHRLKLTARRSAPPFVGGKRKVRAARSKTPPASSLPLPVPETPPPPKPPVRPPTPPPRPPPPVTPRHIEALTAPVGRGLSLLDLSNGDGKRPGDCRWPTNSPPRGGQYLFCGSPQFNSLPYCEYHARLSYAGTKRVVDPAWRPAPAHF
jgi:GcrA cell cycle regulator